MPAEKRKKKRNKTARGSLLRKMIIALTVLLIMGMCSTAFYFYGRIFRPNLLLDSGTQTWVYIKSSASFSDVVQELNKSKLLRDPETFIWMAEFSGYDQKVKPGRYRVKSGMNNRELVNLLKSGAQEPLRITLQGLRKPEQVAGKIGNLLEADSAEIMKRLNDPDFLARHGLKQESALGLFLPDSYTFYWNTPSDSFLSKMSAVYAAFWSDARKKKASNLGLSAEEVAILASIVQQESNKQAEWPLIAGVYLNRLRKGMKLQADPTVKFASGNYDLRRIKGILDINSPYNTYRVHGLPPGLIYMPSAKCIDGVLGAGKHEFLFFCADPDKPGYHRFAKTWSEHELNARKYRRYLDARGIH